MIGINLSFVVSEFSVKTFVIKLLNSPYNIIFLNVELIKSWHNAGCKILSLHDQNKRLLFERLKN